MFFGRGHRSSLEGSALTVDQRDVANSRKQFPAMRSTDALK